MKRFNYVKHVSMCNSFDATYKVVQELLPADDCLKSMESVITKGNAVIGVIVAMGAKEDGNCEKAWETLCQLSPTPAYTGCMMKHIEDVKTEALKSTSMDEGKARRARGSGTGSGRGRGRGRGEPKVARKAKAKSTPKAKPKAKGKAKAKAIVKSPDTPTTRRREDGENTTDAEPEAPKKKQRGDDG